jgi:hypothetical protein
MFDLVARSDEREPRTNERGNKLVAGFLLHADRYQFDFTHCTPAKGWKQYNTSQDASYFGVWVNLELRETVTYCEGDLSVVRCEDDAHLKAELDSMAEFYGDPPPMAVAYDADGTETEYYDPRPEVSP